MYYMYNKKNMGNKVSGDEIVHIAQLTDAF